jgi:hypothetical protein
MDKIELIKENFGDQIWNEVSKLISILTKTGYGCYVWDDDFAVIISFDFRDEEIASHYHYWLNGDEANYIDNLRTNKKDD